MEKLSITINDATAEIALPDGTSRSNMQFVYDGVSALLRRATEEAFIPSQPTAEERQERLWLGATELL